MLAVCAMSYTAIAQDGSSTDQGSFLIEANTGFGGAEIGHAANTSFGLTSSDGNT